MEIKLQKNIKIETSMCDNLSKLSIPSLFTIFMDLACEHAPMLGLGSDTLIPKGLFWVAAKTKVKIHRKPEMLTEATACTWPEAPGRIRTNRYYTLSDQNGVLAEGKTEWAIIDIKTGRPVKLSEVYPENMVHLEEKVCDLPFARIKDDFENCDSLGTYTVRSTDIDIGQHMNNVAYIRALFGAFTCKELESLNFTDIDISFKNQCYEGETLSLLKKKAENGFEIGFIKQDGTVAATISLESNI